MKKIITKRNVFISIVLFYFLGFLYDEDSTGGAKWDFYNYHYPNVEYFRTVPINDAVKDYKSATGPFYYIFSVYLNPLSGSMLGLRLTSLILSLFGLYLFYLIVKKKYFLASEKLHLLLLICLAVSPYYKSSAIWATTDFFGIFFVICAIFFYFNNRQAFKNKLYVLLFCAFAMYTRQYFLILFLILFCFEFIFLQKKQKVTYVIWGLLLLLPELVFVSIWNGLTPPSFQKHSSINLNSIPYIFEYVLFYSLPFGFFYFKKNSFRKTNIIFYMICYITYIYVFSGFYFYPIAGGVLKKTAELVSLKFSEFIFVVISGFGFLYMLFLVRLYTINSILFISLSFFIATEIIYQRYSDPLITILTITLIRFNKNIYLEEKSVYVYLSFLFGFYIFAFIYYNLFNFYIVS